MFIQWLQLGKKIVERLPRRAAMRCPECRNESVDYQYVGDPIDRIGYLDMWCTSCQKGVHISRVEIPENADLISFNASKEQITQRIPSFTQVLPED